MLCYKYWLKLTMNCLLTNGCFMFSSLVGQSLSLLYLILLFKLRCSEHLPRFNTAFWGWTSWSITTKSVLTTKSGPNGPCDFGRWPIDLGNRKQRMAHRGRQYASIEDCPYHIFIVCFFLPDEVMVFQIYRLIQELLFLYWDLSDLLHSTCFVEVLACVPVV